MLFANVRCLSVHSEAPWVPPRLWWSPLPHLRALPAASWVCAVVSNFWFEMLFVSLWSSNVKRFRVVRWFEAEEDRKSAATFGDEWPRSVKSTGEPFQQWQSDAVRSMDLCNERLWWTSVKSREQENVDGQSKQSKFFRVESELVFVYIWKPLERLANRLCTEPMDSRVLYAFCFEFRLWIFKWLPMRWFGRFF